MCNAIIRGTRCYQLLLLPHGVGPVSILVLTIIFIDNLNWKLSGALLGQLIGWAFWIILFFWCIRHDFSGKKVRCQEEIRVILHSLLPVGIFLTCTTVLGNFDRLFVRNFLTSESGGYGAVVTLGAVPSLIIAGVSFVVFPLAAAAHATGRDLRKFLTQALLLGACITICCSVSYLLMGYPLMTFWKSEFAPFSRYLWPYTLAMGLHGMIMIIGYIELARDKHDFLWILVFLTFAMCSVLYFGRNFISIARILVILNVVYIIILGAMYWYATRDDK